ncbi:MAG TPA: hypothetical protein VJZ51_03495, partial [Bacilli bacterium]|nr:hypothetical protein [Bacilli bacterium]
MAYEVITFEKFKFNFEDEYSFCGYVQGGFKLCSDNIEISILKSNIEYTKLGNIQSKEDFANFLFGLVEITYFSSIYHNGGKIAYAIYKPIFSSKSRQMTCLISSDIQIFAVTF